MERVSFSGWGDGDIGVREEEGPDVWVEGETVYAITGGIDEDGRGSVEQVTCGDLIFGFLEELLVLRFLRGED